MPNTHDLMIPIKIYLTGVDRKYFVLYDLTFHLSKYFVWNGEPCNFISRKAEADLGEGPWGRGGSRFWKRFFKISNLLKKSICAPFLIFLVFPWFQLVEALEMF